MHFPLFEDEGKIGEEGEMANLFTIFDAQTEAVDQRQEEGSVEYSLHILQREAGLSVRGSAEERHEDPWEQ